MPKCCIVCNAVASPDIMLQYCAARQSAMYCSRTCQRKDWKKQHKQICKLLNVGHGDMQFGDAFVAKHSPLLVLLQLVDPNVLFGGQETSITLLHNLACLADPFNCSNPRKSAHPIEHGANVNAVTIPQGKTPLHSACYGGFVTNLDFVELLLVESADPNAQDHLGYTPMMCTIRLAPGAANFVLNWPTTDVNSTTRSGVSFLAKARETVEHLSERAARPANPNQVQVQFLLQLWRGIEEMLVERGAQDTGITVIE